MLRKKGWSAILLREDCNIDYSEYQQYQKSVNIFLKEIEQNSTVVWLKDYRCKNEICQVDIEKTFIYKDNDHHCVEGSIKLLKDVQIEEFKSFNQEHLRSRVVNFKHVIHSL